MGIQVGDNIYEIVKLRSKHKQASKTKPVLYRINELGCHEVFSHHKDKDGYTRILRRKDGKKRMYYLHRYLFELEFGVIPEGLVVRHSCDNPSCVNLEHLTLGTPLDNNGDKVKRNRQARGEHNGNAKLTREEVLRIKADKRDALVVAKEYGITRTHVYYLRSGQNWRHLGESDRGANGFGSSGV